MDKSLFILSDGTQLRSGVGAVPAVESVRLTRSANSDSQLRLGAACAAMLEFTLIDTSGCFRLTAGEQVEYYRESDTGEKTLVGKFLLELPTRPSPHRLKCTAYDRMILLDRDLTDWLDTLDGWPYTMEALLQHVCTACGVEAAGFSGLPNLGKPVPEFHRQVTGRQLVKWIAEANGAYAQMNRAGQLELKRFAEAEALALPVLELRLAEYETESITGAAYRHTPSGPWVTWPEDAAGEVYTVTDNPMLVDYTEDSLLTWVEGIAQAVRHISYTPATVRVLDPKWECSPGQFLSVTDRQGKIRCVAVFTVTHRGSTAILTGTGSPGIHSAWAAASRDTLAQTRSETAQLREQADAQSAAGTRTDAAVEQVTAAQNTSQRTLQRLERRVKAAETALSALQTDAEALSQADEAALRSRTALEERLNAKADAAGLAALRQCLEPGEEDLLLHAPGGMRLRLSQDRGEFLLEESCLTVTSQGLETGAITAQTGLKVGNFSLFPTKTGHLTLKCTKTE